jgi:hypothetical protein
MPITPSIKPQITVSHHPEENPDRKSIPALASRIFDSPLTQRVRRNTMAGSTGSGNPFVFNEYPFGCAFAVVCREQRRAHMQQVITFLAVVAGLIFSVAVAVLVEELIFGQVFRLFFTPQPARVKNGATALAGGLARDREVL